MKKIILAFMFGCVLLLTGCSNTVKVPVKSEPIIVQESLLGICTADTPLPKNYILAPNGDKLYNGKEVLSVLIQWQDAYDKCASMHDSLVKAIRELQGITEVRVPKGD